MPKNTRRGKGGHSYRAGPYERPQDESGGRGRGGGPGRGGDRGRGRGALNANSGGLCGGYSSFQGGVQVYGGQGYGSGYGGRGGYAPYPAGGRGRGAWAGGHGPVGFHPSQGSGGGPGAGPGWPNFYGDPGRAAGPAFWAGGAIGQGFYAAGGYDTYGREEGYSHFYNSQQWYPRRDEEDGYVHQGNEQEAPSYDARENEDMAEEAQSASHEVTRIWDMSVVPHGEGFCMYNSQAGGKQENIVGTLSIRGEIFWVACLDGSDESVANLHQMLPSGPKTVSVFAHGPKDILSQEELSKVKFDVNSMNDRLKDWLPEGRPVRTHSLLGPGCTRVSRAI
ncbi:uncharacterized protein FSUBG_5917 [Fusarium subglutinans]|uniref:Uncharacterized protein n=1 Tax=Gibberella subglutinans TaxID=42677 RepID=A0A8H5PZF8_GIBSU|nr:uncharacterized protein FSUBG_5917 [Fusarium subglutinans]KAF5606520.1 hypothetical protein FSUBG_5917 [Fusarium subglutinans]